MGAMIDKFFVELMILGLISPIVAIVAATILYARHRKRVEPERRVPMIGYVFAIIICGAIWGYFGLFFGVERACSVPKAGNLCGLWGFFVTGPIAFALAVLLIGIVVSTIRPAPKPDGDNSN